MLKNISLITVMLVLEINAEAYIDPGFSGSSYRIIYLAIFIGLIFWILKPHRFIQKILFKSKKDDVFKDELK